LALLGQKSCGPSFVRVVVDESVVEKTDGTPMFDDIEQKRSSENVMRVRFRAACAAWEMANLICWILSPCALELCIFLVRFLPSITDGFHYSGSKGVRCFLGGVILFLISSASSLPKAS
jgi:hypothetical protein